MVIPLVTTIVKKLVDKPDQVTVQHLETLDGQDASIIQVRVAPQDLSRLIGSEGRVFRALRMLVQLVSPSELVIDSTD